MITAFKMSAVVGSLLVLINQWEVVTSSKSLHWGKLVLTYMVPYGVSTYSSVKKDLASDRRRGDTRNADD